MGMRLGPTDGQAGRVRGAALILALVISAVTANSTAAGAGSGVVKFWIGEPHEFNQPTFLAQPPEETGRLFVTEKAGRIRLVEGGTVSTFLDISDRVSDGGERGLLSMAFDPDYETSGLLYVYFTNNNGDIRVSEYEVSADPDVADPDSRRAVLKISHRKFANHNGGQLQFGPDGYLYAAPGDGGSAGDPPNNAQDKGSLLGKLLRVDPEPSAKKNHTNPPDNPFAGPTRGKGEIWSLGLRNPYRFSFDRETGALAIGDVGQDSWEEVDYRLGPNPLKGKNLGWSGYEGFAPFKPKRLAGKSWTRPIHVYGHGGGNCSITGGYVVRDPDLTDLVGRYLYADFCLGQLRSFIPAEGVPPGGGAMDDQPLGESVSNPSSFAEDSSGNIYVMSLDTGRVHRLDPGTP